MLRLIGILIGSALAIGFLLITLGTPQLAPPDSGAASTDQAVESQAADQEATAALEIPGTGRNGDPDSPEPGAEAAVPPDPEPDTAMIEQLFAPEASRTVVLPEVPEPAVEEHWYAFWSPFHSEIAANGFVARLQETTGIDYRVVKVKTGVYEVAFAYTDEADIEAKLERIAAATGLDMSGG